MSLICEESHLCFGKEPEPAHTTSHFCFGKRYRPQLDPLEACALTSVLEDSVSQLAILGKTLPENGEVRAEGFRNVDERFRNPPPSPRVFPEMAGRWPPPTDAMLKVQRDRQFAEAILEEVLAELRESGSFGSLRASVDWQGAMIADEENLLGKFEEGLDTRDELVAQLVNDRKNMLEQRAFWEKKTELLTSNLHDTYLLGGLAISYADVWEVNRREQQKMLLDRKEDVLRNEIDIIRDPHEADEERIHAEIMHFLSKDTEALKKDLDHWTDLYDAEMMQRETENIQLRSSLEQRKEEHKQLRAEEQRRKEIVDNAAVLRAEFEEKKKIISSVVAIQAWWRGVSFRAGISIGTTKKGKKGKRKKKGKKKKGSKKKVKAKL